jgi:hypothetical protein
MLGKAFRFGEALLVGSVVARMADTKSKTPAGIWSLAEAKPID